MTFCERLDINADVRNKHMRLWGWSLPSHQNLPMRVNNENEKGIMTGIVM